MSFLRTSVSNGVGEIVLDRPKALNALDQSMIDDMYVTLGEWGDDDAIDTVAAQSERGRVLSSTHRLEPSDVLVVSGVGTAVETLAREADLTVEDTIGRRMSGRHDSLINRDNGICELVIPPRSSWIGRPAFGGMVRAEDGLLVLSVRRQNDDVSSRASTLQEGDALLVYGPWGALDALADDKDVLVVASSETVRRQTVPLGRSAPRAAVILVATIALLASGVVPPVVAGLLGWLAWASRDRSPKVGEGAQPS